MKQILIGFSLCCIGFVGHAQYLANLHANNTPVPSVANNTTTVPSLVKPSVDDALALKESEFNFGKIAQGKPVTHNFEVSNISKTPFKLDNVQASCGCTTPQWEREKLIGAGEKADITIGYNAATEGPFTKTITVTYNGTQTKTILIKGEVWKTPAASAPDNTELNHLKNLN